MVYGLVHKYRFHSNVHSSYQLGTFTKKLRKQIREKCINGIKSTHGFICGQEVQGSTYKVKKTINTFHFSKLLSFHYP